MNDGFDKTKQKAQPRQNKQNYFQTMQDKTNEETAKGVAVRPTQENNREEKPQEDVQ